MCPDFDSRRDFKEPQGERAKQPSGTRKVFGYVPYCLLPTPNPQSVMGTNTQAPRTRINDRSTVKILAHRPD